MNKYLKQINDVVDLIEGQMAEEINISDLAKSVGLSSWHFQRLFKSLVGDSLGGYLRGRRLSIALELLENHNLSILDIAVQVGFTSHEAFTRSFKQKFSLTPKQYREERPKVMTTKKPLLTNELFFHISSGISRWPEIIEMPAMFLSGYEIEIPSPFISDENICQIIADPWWKLLKHKKENESKNYVGITISPSGDYTEENLQYICSEIFYDQEKIKSEEIEFKIPKQKVAAFTIHTDIEEDIAKKTIDYIYGFWLPNSKFKRGKGHDYEYFGNVVDFMNPGSFDYKYIVPLDD